jgi:hypothetical protein
LGIAVGLAAWGYSTKPEHSFLKVLLYIFAGGFVASAIAIPITVAWIQSYETPAAKIVSAPTKVAVLPAALPSTPFGDQSPSPSITTPALKFGQLTSKTIPIDPTVKHLTDLFHGRTYLQAGALIRDSLGKTLTISGPVGNIDDNGHFITVVFERSNIDDPAVYAHFSESSSRKLSALEKGDRVTVKGAISDVRWDAVFLDKCQILNIENDK